MSIDKFNADTLSFGCLVKSWATNLDYVTAGYSIPGAFAKQPPRPPWNTPETDIPQGAAWALPAPMANGTVTLPKAWSLTAQQFVGLLNAAKVQGASGPGSTPNMPSGYKEVIVVQGDDKTLVINLPPMALLQAAEDDIIKNGYSEPASFYRGLYTCDGAGNVVFNPPNGVGPEMILHANRIGDYTMDNCN